MRRKKQMYEDFLGSREPEDYSTSQNTYDFLGCDWNEKLEDKISQDFWRTRNSRASRRTCNSRRSRKKHRFMKFNSNKSRNDCETADLWQASDDWETYDSWLAPNDWGTTNSWQTPRDWETTDSRQASDVWGTNDSEVEQNDLRTNDSKRRQNDWRINHSFGTQNGFRPCNELDSYYPKFDDWLIAEEERAENTVKNCSKTVLLNDIHDSKPVTENAKMTVKKNVMDPSIVQDTSNDLHNDFQTLLKKGDFTDVVLTCGGYHIKAHKLVLSARSPVFATMFASPMQESEKNVIIDDIAQQVIHDLLLFIYSGLIEYKNLDQQKVFDLLYVAEKYQIISLKQVCVEFLKSITSEENALQILQTADLYDDQLKSHTIVFVSKHFSTLKLTNEWKTLQSKNPILAVEVLSNVVELLQAK